MENRDQETHQAWQYRDAQGRERRVPLARDKSAAQAMLNDLVKKAEQEAAGIRDPFDEHRKRPLKDHLTDFKLYLRNKGNSADHVARTVTRVESAIEECSFKTLQSISASRLQGFIGDLRKQGYGITTCNHYLRAFKMFAR